MNYEKIYNQINDVNNWARKNSALFMPKPKSKGGDIDISSDVRAIITTDEETANKIKKDVHNARNKIKVRIMKRKDHVKVYVDTEEPEDLDNSLDTIRDVLKNS